MTLSDVLSEPRPLGAKAHGTFLALRVLQFIGLFCFGLISARYLPPALRAQYVLPLTLAMLCWGVCQLSIASAAGPLMARRNTSVRSIVRALFALVVLLGPPTTLLALALGLAGHHLVADASIATIVLAVAHIPFLYTREFAGQVLLLTGALRSFGAIAAAVAVLQAVALLTVGLFLQVTPAAVMLLSLLGCAINALANAVVVARVLGSLALLPQFDWSIIRQLCRLGTSLHPGTIALQLAPRIDLMIVAALTSAASSGLYALSLSMAEASQMVVISLTLAALHRQMGQDLRSAARYTVAFTRDALHMAILSVALVAIFAYPVIRFGFGQQWLGAVVPWIILSAAATALAVVALMRDLLTRITSGTTLSVIACGAVMINALFTVLAIPLFGIVGAASASVIALWLHAVLLLVVFRRDTNQGLAGLLRPPNRSDLIIRVPLRVVATASRMRM